MVVAHKLSPWPCKEVRDLKPLCGTSKLLLGTTCEEDVTCKRCLKLIKENIQ